jgi:hypothetical protein
MLLISYAALLAACSGGGSGGSMPASGSSSTAASTPTSTASSCSNCGTALVTLTDAPGDFVSYIVNVVSLKLTSTDGAVVETIPATTQVDFAQLVNLSELISAQQIPAGRYVSAALTLDYSNATIVVNDGSAGVTIAAGDIINGAASQPLAAPNPTQVTLTLSLPANEPLTITPNAVTSLALDFNLAASNSIAPSDTDPTTVTVNPVLTASLTPDTTKLIQVRGGFAGASAATSSFTLNLHPFYSVNGAYGQLSVDTTSTTTYAINGTSYTGSAGFTQLAGLPASTMIVASGSWDAATHTFSATSVLAGTSVPATGKDNVSGIVISRSGDTLIVADGLLQRMNAGGICYARQTTVTLGNATIVSEPGQSGSFTIADISVGQQVQASGALTNSATGNSATGTPSLDATAGSVQLIPTVVAGTVASTSADSVTLNLQSIDGFAASMFDFAGTGTSAAQDATAAAYTVALPAPLSPSALSTDTPVQFTGFVAPFGAAPPDFNATTSTSFGNVAVLLQVGWATGDTAPFSTMSATGLTISQTALQTSSQHVIRAGFETIDPSTLAGGLQLVPDTSAASHQYFAIGHRSTWMVNTYTTFGNFEAALSTDLNGSTQMLQLSARGPYAAATGVLSADELEVVLSD